MKKNLRHILEVSDSALMHMCLMGLESYHHPRRHVETYGLLWGTSSYKEHKKPDEIRYHYRIDHALTDIEAERTKDEVRSDLHNLELKKRIIEDCWPALSFLGDFHTHPFEDEEDARGRERLSDGDREDVEESRNRTFWYRVGLKINLVMSIYPLGNAGSKDPVRVKNHIVEWTLRDNAQKEYYRLQLAAYVINKVRDGRRHSLILTPRERGWNNRWIKERKIKIPEQEIWLQIPSVLGTYNFWKR